MNRVWVRILGRVGVVAAVLTTAALVPSVAHAGGQDCRWPTTCGTVTNNAVAQMRIATIENNPSSQHDPSGKPTYLGATCNVWDPSGQLKGRQPCYWTSLASGRTSPSTGRFKDVDAFTFPNTGFLYNGIPRSRGIYVRITGGHSALSQHVVCERLPGLAPKCWG